MEVKNYPKWKETNIGGTHFQLPWLWEEGEAPFRSHGVRPFGRGTTRSLGVLLTMVINHLLVGIILQVTKSRGFWTHDSQILFGMVLVFFVGGIRDWECGGSTWKQCFLVRVSAKTFECWVQWFFAVIVSLGGGGRKSYHYFMSF